MNQIILKTFLDIATIPEIKKKPKTFLSISKQPHYENVISNTYAFFFRVHEEHGLNDLFIRSLVECINEHKIGDKDFSNFCEFAVETEYPTKGKGKTKKKGRIDLLLLSSEQAIIIENKIYHYLANDLDDYWQSVELDTDNTNQSKIGIILSLKPISKDLYKEFENKNKFINITHLNFMRKVMANSATTLNAPDSKYFHFLHDFHQNIINLSSPTMNKVDINFYTENKEKINQLVLFKQQFKNHVVAEVEKAGHAINNVKLIVPKHKSNARRLRYYRSTSHSELLYTIIYDGLSNEKNDFHIIIEPRGSTLKNGEQLRQIVFNEHEKKILNLDFYKKTNEPWAHFASRIYKLKAEEITDLSGFIQKKIEEDGFATIFEKLEQFLKVQ